MVRFFKFLSVFVFVVNIVTAAFGADIAIGESSRDCDSGSNGIGATPSVARLAAEWIPNTISLSWYNGGDIVSGQSSCTYDTSFSVPSAPTKTGYVFDGWLLTALPSAYTRLAYLESTGTQCIDTGVTLSSDNIVYKWTGLDNSTSNGTSLFGSEGGSPKTYNDLLYGNKTNRKVYIGSGSTDVNATANNTVGYYVSSDNAFHTWSFVIRPDNTLYLVKDGTALSTVSWGGSLNKSVTVALFCNHSSSNFTEKSSAAFKYFKIYDNNNLVFDGIPARRNSDGVLGMYDTVSKTFLTNVGSGTFTAGPDILVPSNYTQLEYIESTGTQYINSGIYFDIAKNFRVKGMIINPDVTKRKVILGNYQGDSAVVYALEFGGSANSAAGKFRNYISSGSSSTSVFASSAQPANTPIFYDSVYNATNHTITNALTYNGSTTTYSLNTINASGTTTRSLRFFLDYRSSPSAIANPVSIGETEIYKDNVLIGHFVPARRNSDDEIGMYDTVTGEFFTNAGTGTFVAGPDL